MDQSKQEKIILQIKVIPNASFTEIVEQKEGYLKIRLKALPKDNEANEELIRFLALHFNTSRSNIVILQGRKSRLKKVQLTCK